MATERERVRFPGDPAIQETGTGKGPDIPLSPNVAPASVQMLDQDKAEDAPEPRKKTTPQLEGDDDQQDEIDEDAPAYAREQVGARIGLPLEASQAAAEVETQLDTEDCVPCLFPTNVKLQDAGIMHTWAPGMHLVPISLAGVPGDKSKPMHWWLVRNKVRRAAKQTVQNPKVAAEG
jgi:hypothetical protein